MKLYTFYTESHRNLNDIMIESLKKTNSKIDVISDKFEQECDGNFMSNGWNSTMHKKVDQIIESCRKGEIFIHSDSDVYFFKDIHDDILSELSGFDIAFQDDGVSGLCMGFFICKPSKELISLFHSVKLNIDKIGNDQLALNALINKFPIKYKKLSNKYFSYGQLNRGVWNGEYFKLPTEICVLHANWTIGIENKIKLLKLNEVE